jgi:hypothetical protein
MAASHFFQQLTPEQKLLLLLVKSRQSDEVISEAEKLFLDSSSPVNDDKLFSMAADNGVASLIYRNSRDLEFIPQNLTERLKNAYYNVLSKNAKHLEETFRISNALKNNGIESIVLKGSAASVLLFGDPGVYPTGDIDILVRVADISNTSGVLKDIGYEMFDRADMIEGSDYLNYQGNTYFLDLHLKPIASYFDIPDEFWWGDPVNVTLCDHPLKVLSAERYFLFAVLHLFSHQFRTLKFFVLIDAVISRQEGGVDWDKAIEYSERYGLKRTFFLTLKLLHEIVGTEVPVLIRDNTLWGYGLFRDIVLGGLFQKSTMVFLRTAVYLVLLPGPLALVRTSIKAFFPSAARLRARYGLSEHSKLVYIYYALNPFLILFKR